MGLFDLLGAEKAHDEVHGGHEGSMTHELIAGAAGFAAMRAYEKHREAEGIKGHHELGKELIAGFAAAECDKLFETKGLNFLDREKAKHAAKEQAEHLFQHHNW